MTKIVFFTGGLLLIVVGLTTRRFFAGAMGINHPDATTFVWLGRSLSILGGGLFLYMGLGGALPLLSMRVLAVVFGSSVIILGRTSPKFNPTDSSSESATLTVPQRRKLRETVPLWVWRMVFGLFFILVGLFARR
jgi:hypothetical protein